MGCVGGVGVGVWVRMLVFGCKVCACVVRWLGGFIVRERAGLYVPITICASFFRSKDYIYLTFVCLCCFFSLPFRPFLPPLPSFLLFPSLPSLSVRTREHCQAAQHSARLQHGHSLADAAAHRALEEDSRTDLRVDVGRRGAAAAAQHGAGAGAGSGVGQRLSGQIISHQYYSECVRVFCQKSSCIFHDTKRAGRVSSDIFSLLVCQNKCVRKISCFNHLISSRLFMDTSDVCARILETHLTSN